MDEHNSVVNRIATQIQSFHARKEPFRIYHGSTNSTRRTTFDRKKIIDTSTLNHVLHVDTQSRTVLVEPNVRMDALVAATLPHGLVPPVVMEFPGITVGGGFSGSAAESSSFKAGFFDKSVNWVEFVLAGGEVVRASEGERKDLFHAAAGSLGTLGVATCFEMRLVQAREFVELSYLTAGSVGEGLRVMEEATEDERNDYVDGIVMAKDRCIICVGRLTDRVEPGLKVQRLTRARDPWFYIHADRATREAQGPVRECIPLKDYLFRYDRGAFWTGAYAYK